MKIRGKKNLEIILKSNYLYLNGSLIFLNGTGNYDKFMKEKAKIIISAFSIIIFIGIITYFWIFSRDKFKCPNDYVTVLEYVDGTAKWISDKMSENPNFSEENILQMRTKELDTHKCESSKWLNS